METDRHAPDEGVRPEPPAPERRDGDPHEYGYGADPLQAAGTGRQRDVDSGASTETAETSAQSAPQAGSASEAGSPSQAGSPSASDHDSLPVLHPATGVRGTTAPRAVLRPVPEGFPTPPPRPAVPNRRPAPKQSLPEGPKPRRRLVIAGVAVAAALLLIVVVGGGLLAARTLVSPSPEAGTAGAPGQPAPSAGSGPSSVMIGDVQITELSTELGLRAVGPSSGRLQAEGEFIVVTFEVVNSSDTPVRIGNDVMLETADGTHAPDSEAGFYYVSDTSRGGIVSDGETMQFHVVYDVPIGTAPTGLHFSIDQGSATLPLGG